MRVAITGSHGLIGSALLRSLESDDHEVVPIVRGGPAPGSVAWDPRGGTIDAAGLEGLHGVVHLAGEPLGDGRWTDAKKERILASRVEGTRLLARTLAALDQPPAVLVSGSAIGIYGDRGDEQLTEQSSLGSDFLAEVCKRWEAASEPAEQAGVRVVHLRTGLVLSADGGLLKRMLPVFKLGAGGRLASGRQWWSWVTIDDEVGIIRHALSSEAVTGPINAVAPDPVTNEAFTKALGSVLGRPTLVPVPSFGLKVVMGAEMTDVMILASQRVQPAVAESTGYTFRHTDVEQGLRAVLGR